MENLGTSETNLVEKKEIAKFGFLSPKVLAILLLVNLIIGIFNLVGVSYLSFKDNNRTQMIRNFDNNGFNGPNGGMFNQQQQPSSGSTN